MSKILAALLIVSVAFNAMFAVGYFRAHSAEPPVRTEDEFAERLAAKLGLTDAQREALVALRTKRQERAVELSQAALLAQEALWLESCDPKSDPQRLEEVKNDLFRIRETQRELGFEQFEAFLKLLTPEQREHVRERVRRGPPGPPPWCPRFQAFDLDHDGALSPKERDQALREMRQGYGAPGRGPGPGWRGGPMGGGQGPPPGKGPGWRGGSPPPESGPEPKKSDP